MRMGARPKQVLPVKVFSGLILSKSLGPDICLPAIEKVFGKADFKSRGLDFCRYSSYYNEEMGDGLTRYFIAFKDLADRTELPDFKIRAQAVEKEFSVQGKRTLNLDPGYLTLGQVFLASTKDNFFRIYLRDGVYAEVTLYFKGGEYRAFPWTYPDYADRPYRDILNEIRTLYKTQLDCNQGSESDGETA